MPECYCRTVFEASSLRLEAGLNGQQAIAYFLVVQFAWPIMVNDTTLGFCSTSLKGGSFPSL